MKLIYSLITFLLVAMLTACGGGGGGGGSASTTSSSSNTTSTYVDFSRAVAENTPGVSTIDEFIQLSETCGN